MPNAIYSDPSLALPQVVSGQLSVEGIALKDYPQLVVKAIASQASPAVSVQNSAGTQVASIDQAGNVSASGTLAVTGATTLTGVLTAPTNRTVVQSAAVGATVVLTAAQSGGIFENASTSGSPSWTLPAPAAANKGSWYTFVTSNTTTGQTITCGGGTSFKYHTTAAGTVLSTATVTNTQGTAVVGDSITFYSNGTVYLSIAQTGIWA